MSSKDASPSPPAFPFADRADRHAVEHALAFAPKFDANGLIPVVTTDAHTREVLMVAYMNEESLRRTLELGEAVYYSRSRQELWHKGATSGQIQKVLEMRVDCDQDTLVLAVEQAGGGCCHVGHPTCFYRAVDMDAARDNRAAVVPLAATGA
jgi:phosphoribosyl-AMP cyclohydrolase